jgi:sugar lactone lactonase YvrE
MIARLPSVRRLLVLLVLGTILVIPATAGASTFPDTIRLPDGWQPEGIASGRGTSLYVGSIPTGAVWKGDARTGRGDVLVPGQTGRSAIGIKVDKRNRLFVAGGGTGKAFVYDARTGRDLASYQLAAAGAATFVNDVAVTSKAAWFTDSRAAQLYALPLGRHGKLPGQDKVCTLALKGDFQLQEGNNLNGIVAAKDGRVLLAVQTNTGKLSGSTPAPA